MRQENFDILGVTLNGKIGWCERKKKIDVHFEHENPNPPIHIFNSGPLGLAFSVPWSLLNTNDQFNLSSDLSDIKPDGEL